MEERPVLMRRAGHQRARWGQSAVRRVQLNDVLVIEVVVRVGEEVKPDDRRIGLANRIECEVL